MSILSDYKKKFAIARDGNQPRTTRFFAAAELICQPVSFLSVITVIAFAILRRTGVWTPPPVISRWVVPVLVAAAVGYLTNWIAITMLFEPYERTWRHWLPWATLGAWRQGLLPKNKARIAEVLADQVATKLLQPEKLANDLCAMVGGALQDPEVLRAAQTLLQEQVAAHDAEIVDFLVPRIENALAREIDRLVTADQIKSFWDAEIMPRLESAETREYVAKLVLEAIRKRSAEIAAKAKPAISAAIRRYVEEDTLLGSIPLLGSVLSHLADGLASFFLSEQTIEKGLLNWIRHPEATATMRDELAGFVASFRDWLASPEGSAMAGGFVGNLRARFRTYLRAYLRKNLAPTVTRLLHSDAAWEWIADVLPTIRPGVERMIREIGTTAIIEKINVEGRVKAAVDGMDMAEFHGMLNEIMAEHLGAIQVLGYVLGVLAGLLLALT